MNIQNHIKALLYRHDCVIVKGLGGFVCQRQSAEIKDGFFIPPKKILTFNQSLNQGDGLLANHVAKEEKVSFQIAQQKIQAFARKILETLDEENEIYLKSLGYFSKNENLKLVFKPDTENQWLAEAYGLPKFKVSQVEVDKPKAVIADPVKEPKAEPKSEVKTLHENQPKPNYWKYAAVGVIALGIAGLVGSQFYQKDIKAYNIAEQQKAEKLIDQKIQQSSFLFDKPLTPLSVEVKTPKAGKYHIVGGAFRVRANVDKKIKRLQKQGFDARYIGTNKYGLHQVVYASFHDKKEALQNLKQIKAKNNPYAWLYVKEL